MNNPETFYSEVNDRHGLSTAWAPYLAFDCLLQSLCAPLDALSSSFFRERPLHEFFTFYVYPIMSILQRPPLICITQCAVTCTSPLFLSFKLSTVMKITIFSLYFWHRCKNHLGIQPCKSRLFRSCMHHCVVVCRRINPVTIARYVPVRFTGCHMKTLLLVRLITCAVCDPIILASPFSPRALVVHCLFLYQFVALAMREMPLFDASGS
jgi:hypothetical protein